MLKVDKFSGGTVCSPVDYID